MDTVNPESASSEEPVVTYRRAENADNGANSAAISGADSVSHTPAEVQAYADRLHARYREQCAGDDRRALTCALASVEMSLLVGPTRDCGRQSPAFLFDLSDVLRNRLAGLVLAEIR